MRDKRKHEFKNKIINRLTRNIPNYLDIIFYFLLLIICYFCFNQGDILNTGGSSFTYLNGHIKDFYDINNNVIGIGDAYLPSTYILFAIWNIPIKLLGIVNQATEQVGYVIFWYKLLTTLFLAASGFIMYNIGKLLGLGSTNSKLLTIIWVSSPLLFFSQFIFGQYDIFTLFFVLAGLYYFLQKKTWRFILFFAISLTFKYYTLFMFIPLLLLLEKNPLKILGSILISLIPVVAEIAFYMSSVGFISGVFGGGFENYLFLTSFSYWNGEIDFNIFIFLFIVICGICYYIEPAKTSYSFSQTVIYTCCLISCLFFILSRWNPQWIMWTTPFLAITTFMQKKIKYFLLLDFLMMIPFIGFVVIIWVHNVDQSMWLLGILGKLNPSLSDFDNVFTMSKIFTLGFSDVNLIKSIYFMMFSAILLINILLKFPTKRNSWDGNNKLIDAQEYWNYERLRFFGGISIFIIPAIMAYVLTLAG